jgi:Domain of unknown function (DUF4365)
VFLKWQIKKALFFNFENKFLTSIFVKPTLMRKQRTREHIIEDLGFNYVERQILYAGFTVQRYMHNDYGYDGLFHTYNDMGEIEPQMIHFQLKSTDAIQFSKKENAFAFDLSQRDLELWLRNSIKMLLILYDAQREFAYFEDIQEYFRKNTIKFKQGRKFVRIFIPIEKVVDAHTVKQLRLS